jgi:phage gp36-like protein
MAGMVAHNVIAVFRSWKQENLKFKTSLGYIVRHCLNNNKMEICSDKEARSPKSRYQQDILLLTALAKNTSWFLWLLE